MAHQLPNLGAMRGLQERVGHGWFTCQHRQCQPWTWGLSKPVKSFKYDLGYMKQTVDTRLLKHDSGQTTSCTDYLCFGLRLYSLWLNRWLRLLSIMLQTRLNGRSDLKHVKALLTVISPGQPLSPTRFRIQATLRVLWTRRVDGQSEK
jgi:hypothetical protein